MRCRLSIVLLMLLLAGCASPDSTVEIDTFSPETETPTLTFTPTVSPTATSILANRTPRPTRTPIPSPIPTYDPFIDPTIIYPDGLAPLTAHRRLGIGLISDLEVSPDRRSFALGTTTGVYVFDSQTYDLLWSASTRAPVEDIKWSPVGDSLAAVLPSTNSILVWDAGGQFMTRLEISDLGTSFDWSPDGKQIVTAKMWYDESHQVKQSAVIIWNVETGEETGFYETDPMDPPFIGGLRWSPDGQYVAFGAGWRDENYILDLAAGNFLTLETPEGITHELIEHFEFSPNGSKVLSYSGWLEAEGDPLIIGCYAIIWDMDSFEMLFPLSPFPQGSCKVADAGWSPDGQYVAAVYPSRDSTSHFSIWNAATGENVLMHGIYGYFLSELDWSPDGTTLIVTGYIYGDDGDEGTLFLIDLSDPITIEKEGAHSPRLSDWLSDEKLLVASREDLSMRDIPTRSYDTIIRSGYDVSQLAQSPDGTIIAALPQDEAETATYWDVQTWEPMEIDQENLPLDDWLFANDNPYKLASSTNYAYELIEQPAESYSQWDSITIKLLDDDRTVLDYSESDAVVYSNAVSMDGRYIAFGFGHPMCNGCPRLSPMEQAYILLFDTETETYVTLYGHTGQVTSLLFLPDGDLVSGSADGTIIVWDIP